MQSKIKVAKIDVMRLRKKLFDQIPVNDAIDYFSSEISQQRLEKLKAVLKNRSRFIIPVMEDLYQEQNAGAIIRSADCCGFQEVGIIELNNTYTLAPGIAKGAQKWVDTRIFDAENSNPMMEAVNYYRENGYLLVGACPHEDDFSSQTLPIDKPIALFFGAEKMGLHDDLRNQMDSFVSIPMRGFTESYNVSVSAAILLQSLRQRLEVSSIDFQMPHLEKQSVLLEWIIRSMPKGPERLNRWLSSIDHRN